MKTYKLGISLILCALMLVMLGSCRSSRHATETAVAEEYSKTETAGETSSEEKISTFRDLSLKMDSLDIWVYEFEGTGDSVTLIRGQPDEVIAHGSLRKATHVAAKGTSASVQQSDSACITRASALAVSEESVRREESASEIVTETKAATVPGWILFAVIVSALGIAGFLFVRAIRK